MLRYYKLFDLLNRRNMKKTDLLKVISSPTLAKISKGKNIQTDAIDKICLLLECQPGDIMECVFFESDLDEYGNKTVGIKTMYIDDDSDYVETDLSVDERKIPKVIVKSENRHQKNHK